MKCELCGEETDSTYFCKIMIPKILEICSKEICHKCYIWLKGGEK